MTSDIVFQVVWLWLWQLFVWIHLWNSQPPTTCELGNASCNFCWWLRPISRMYPSNRIISPGRGENKTYLKTPSSFEDKAYLKTLLAQRWGGLWSLLNLFWCTWFPGEESSGPCLRVGKAPVPKGLRKCNKYPSFRKCGKTKGLQFTSQTKKGWWFQPHDGSMRLVQYMFTCMNGWFLW